VIFLNKENTIDTIKWPCIGTPEFHFDKDNKNTNRRPYVRKKMGDGSKIEGLSVGKTTVKLN